MKEWVRRVTEYYELGEHAVAEANAKIFTFGSYRLGVHGPGAAHPPYSAIKGPFHWLYFQAFVSTQHMPTCWLLTCATFCCFEIQTRSLAINAFESSRSLTCLHLRKLSSCEWVRRLTQRACARDACRCRHRYTMRGTGTRY